MSIPKNVQNYVLYYAGFCVAVDFLDRRTDLFQKQTGFFGKAYDFPWTDGWSVMHIIWGGLAQGMNVPIQWYLPLAMVNDFVLEQALCRLSKHYTWIRYARECDSFPHIITDLLWGLGGYYAYGWVLKPNRS